MVLLSLRASRESARRRKLLRALLKKTGCGEKEEARNQWVVLEADAESNAKMEVAANRTVVVALVLSLLYLGLVFLLSGLEQSEHFQRPIDVLYFWATSVTTVGFGDITVQQQRTRGLAIRECVL